MQSSKDPASLRPRNALLLYFSYDPTRIASCKNVGRYVPGHHTTCANDASVSNAHSRTNDSASSYPYIFSNSNRTGIFKSRTSFDSIHWMCGRIELYIRPQHAAAANDHRSNIQDNTVEVKEHLFPYLKVIAVIAIKGGLQP